MSTNEKIALNTTIQKEVLQGFKELCKENGVSMNSVLEVFMKQCVNGQLKIITNLKIEKKDE